MFKRTQSLRFPLRVSKLMISAELESELEFFSELGFSNKQKKHSSLHKLII